MWGTSPCSSWEFQLDMESIKPGINNPIIPPGIKMELGIKISDLKEKYLSAFTFLSLEDKLFYF